MWTSLLALLMPVMAFEFTFPQANDTVDLGAPVTITWQSEAGDASLVELIWNGDYEGGIGTWHAPLGDNISVQNEKYEFDPQIVLDYLEHSEPVIYEGHVHHIQALLHIKNQPEIDYINNTSAITRSKKFSIEGYKSNANRLRPLWEPLTLALVTFAGLTG